MWRKVQQNAAAANAANQFGGGCGLQDTYAETHFFGNGISKLVFMILSAVEPLDSSARRPARRGNVFFDYIRLSVVRRLAVELKAANALRNSVPLTLLGRADEVIK